MKIDQFQWTSADWLVTDYGDGSKFDTFGVPDYSYHAGGIAFQHRYNAPGRYRMKAVVIVLGYNYLRYKIDSSDTRVNVSCHPPAGGEVFFDANSNCSYDSADTRINLAVKIQVDSAGIPVDTISEMGTWQYHILADSPTIYTFKLLKGPTGYTATCPSNGIITYSFHQDSLAMLDQHFGFQCSSAPVLDYRLSIFRALRSASSGGGSYVGLYASNNSCHRDSGTIVLHVSPKYNIDAVGISPGPFSVSGQTVTWNHANMVDGSTSQYYVPLIPLATTVNGDTACTYAVITPVVGDSNTANNFIAICDSVRSSWDPNEKAVFPKGAVSAGTMLTYTIDFENKGNDTAFQIHVQDTLSEHLDPNSFQILSTTHAVRPYLYETADRKAVIKFEFQDIRLAAKDDVQHNKGQVRFEIKMKDPLPDGTIVANRAGIYFDRNPVVLTNTAYNHIPNASGISGIRQAPDIKVYPNPATEAVTILVVTKSWDNAVLSNSMGQAVARLALVSGENILRVHGLPPGIYYLQSRGSAGISTVKLEKR